MRASLVLAAVALLATAATAAHAAQQYPIADLKNFPQDAAAYVSGSIEARVASEQEQDMLAADFLRRRFAPWLVPDLSYLNMDIASAAASYGGYASRTFYTSDGKKFSSAKLKEIGENGRIDVNASPRAGIIVAPCDARVLPTSTLLAKDPSSARGERGLLRLDVLQVSSLKVGEPVAIWSVSRDGDWYFVANDCVAGWVKSSAAAFVPDDVRTALLRAEHAAAVRDNVKLDMPDGSTVTMKMGGLLASDGAGGLLVPRRNANALAELVRVSAPDGSFELFPIPFTRRNAVRAAGELVGEPYGWGGLDGHRDCSAMTRDFFALFGSWLPRNSGDQELHGARADVKQLSPALKNKVIADRALPFRTIVHLPGHIMLYIGTRDGAPMVLHNMWGIRVDAGKNKVGRRVVGKAVITTLRAGAEIKGRAKRSLLEDNVDSFTDAFALEGRELF